MKQAIRIKQITIRVAHGAALSGPALASRIAGQITIHSGTSVPRQVQAGLASQLSERLEKRG